ncbi:uncharacterized protein DS421_19g657370 [Arachis hypogaea]|uniref:Uncharacterized protein n=1 Tax=Arachis hypogaea TaxID=3818 RepID=A0A6B9V924_ARAHY|nr:uncharacterized protein DS421_19g657370 [Arachis hypogaea]
MQGRENLVSDIPLNLASHNHSLKTHSISAFSVDNRPPPPSQALLSPPIALPFHAHLSSCFNVLPQI